MQLDKRPTLVHVNWMMEITLLVSE